MTTDAAPGDDESLRRALEELLTPAAERDGIALEGSWRCTLDGDFWEVLITRVDDGAE